MRAHCLNKEKSMKTANGPVTGRIFNIQHFSVEDGPGIRTTVFLKGCPLRCAWCHNPESHDTDGEIMFRADRCVSCGACARVCETGAHTFSPDGEHIFDRTHCQKCGDCTKECFYEAVEKIGGVKTVDDVLFEILADRVFYEKSGGGVTVSGGEPTAQPKFTEALLRECKKEGLHTCVETCGWCSPDTLLRIMPYTDLFLLDWKITDDGMHEKFTGVSNKLIVENLALLNEKGARVILRCPLIPEVNLTEDHFNGIAELAGRFVCISCIDLEPYHPMGISKAVSLGKELRYTNGEFMSAEHAEEIAEYIKQRTDLPVRVLGK